MSAGSAPPVSGRAGSRLSSPTRTRTTFGNSNRAFPRRTPPIPTRIIGQLAEALGVAARIAAPVGVTSSTGDAARVHRRAPEELDARPAPGSASARARSWTIPSAGRDGGGEHPLHPEHGQRQRRADDVHDRVDPARPRGT